MKEKKEIVFECGCNEILLSAPHGYMHKRNNFNKKGEVNTLQLIEEVRKLTNCHIVYINKNINYDPNYNIVNNYKKELEKYINDNNIKYMIDIHGMKDNSKVEFELGTNCHKNLNGDITLYNGIIDNLRSGDYKFRVDKKFKATKRTVSAYVNKVTKIPTLQIELTKKMRTDDFNRSAEMLVSLSDYLINQSANVINYQEIYDKVLDIKPSFNYTRELGVVLYNFIGLEIEIAVNYERDSYSFIKKMLTKIKNIVGDNGYFVKDNTIKGLYNFEIVLDPLPVNKIMEVYTEIYEVIKFSDGLIESSNAKSCGLHANFNKKDVLDLNVAHNNLINLLLNNKLYFNSNRYKQEKILLNYDEYCNFQDKIGDKYLWINYQKTKIIEIRNIKAGLAPRNLEYVLNYLLKALYYDKELELSNYSKLVEMSEICELINSNYKLLKKNKKITIMLDKNNDLKIK